jgi:hypothetical protein
MPPFDAEKFTNITNEQVIKPTALLGNGNGMKPVSMLTFKNEQPNFDNNADQVKPTTSLNLNKTNQLETKPMMILKPVGKDIQAIAPTVLLNKSDEIKPMAFADITNIHNVKPILNIGGNQGAHDIKPMLNKTNEQGFNHLPKMQPLSPHGQFGTKAGLQNNLVSLILTYRIQN